MGTRETNEIFGNIDLSLMHKPYLEQFWSLESIGMTDSPRMLDDDKALERRMINYFKPMQQLFRSKWSEVSLRKSQTSQ